MASSFTSDRLRPAADPAAFACGGQARDDALLNQGALVLRERTEHLNRNSPEGVVVSRFSVSERNATRLS